MNNKFTEAFFDKPYIYLSILLNGSLLDQYLLFQVLTLGVYKILSNTGMTLLRHEIKYLDRANGSFYGSVVPQERTRGKYSYRFGGRPGYYLITPLSLGANKDAWFVI